MFAAALCALLVCMCLSLVRSMLGPSVFDRILALNSFGTKTVLLIAVIGFVFGRPAFLDVGISYAMINFVATVALMKFFRYRSLETPLTPAGPRGSGEAGRG
jgi:multicomponent Na+:H+ antiporter subunit F